MTLMLLSGCWRIGSPVSEPPALCKGLSGPIDDLAQALVDNKEKTPAQVIITGARVVSGFDGGCQGNT